MQTSLPTPSPAARPPSPGGESRDAGLGGTHPAGGEAPERLAAPKQHSGKEHSRGRRGGAGGKWEAQPGRGLQTPRPGRPRSLLAAKASPRTGPLASPRQLARPRPLHVAGLRPLQLAGLGGQSRAAGRGCVGRLEPPGLREIAKLVRSRRDRC